MIEPVPKTDRGNIAAITAGGLAVLGALFVVRYAMPFRLDDVLLVEWANAHTPLEAFDPIRGQIVNSVRPIFALTAWMLSHTAGLSHPFFWHLVLVLTLLTGLYFTGKTAQRISGSSVTLPLTPLFYLVGFVSILNVFFWFSDLTYGLELAFAALSWYFGLRGLSEGNLRDWVLGILFGALAVLSKEPAVILVHTVFAGSVLLNGRAWKSKWSKQSIVVAAALYAALVSVTLYVILVSPTRTNRFFPFSSPDLSVYVLDRLRYYGDIYCRFPNRLILFFPVILNAMLVQRWKHTMKNTHRIGLCVGLSLLIALLLCSHFLLAIVIVVVALCVTALYDPRSAAKLLIPFGVVNLIAALTLLITVQLVKTQLTEMAYVTSLIAAVSWCAVWSYIRKSIPFSDRLKQRRAPMTIALAFIAVIVVFECLPMLRRQERSLTSVAAVRWNANNAIQWAARSLPQNATLATCSYSLYGIDGAGTLTGRSDEEKIVTQYTFESGYVFIYLQQLGRGDITRAYLEGPGLTRRVLEAMRRDSNCYLFLQSPMDITRFHDAQAGYLNTSSDSLVYSTTEQSYRSEIWKLGGRTAAH